MLKMQLTVMSVDVIRKKYIDIIEIEHLNKSFGDVKAVNDLSFRVKERWTVMREVAAFVDRNRKLFF